MKNRAMEKAHNPDIIYEDNHLIAVSKPPGLLVQGDITGDKTLLDFTKMFIKLKYNKPGDVFLGLVHRLDRPVSGIIVMAKTGKALSRMNELFRSRDVRKTYLAITLGVPEKHSDTLRHHLLKDHRRNISRVVSPKTRGALQATLQYELLSVMDGKALLKIGLHSGRPHQIRVQLAAIGTPIAGDLKYGATKALPDKSIALHALSLHFIHPVRRSSMVLRARPLESYPWSVFDMEGV